MMQLRQDRRTESEEGKREDTSEKVTKCLCFGIRIYDWNFELPIVDGCPYIGAYTGF